MSALLCQKYAPKTVEDMVLSPENMEHFGKSFDLSSSPNLLFLGNAGVGKTTLAKILAKNYDYLYINASDENGIDTIRTKVTDFVRTASMFNDIKVVVLDEADGLSSTTTGGGSSAQQALRGLINENLDNARFILTANYEHKLIEALHSRCQTFRFSLTRGDVAKRLAHIIREEKIKTTKESVVNLINSYFPDLRKCINELQRGLNDNNTFILDKTVEKELPNKIKLDITSKTDVFTIRQYVINSEDEFSRDYLSLMRGLYTLYCNDRNRNAVMACCSHMEKHERVLDKEVNFTALLLNLTQC